jgi:hypothetical protein
MKRLKKILLTTLLGVCTLTPAQGLYDNFVNPSQEWRPRVWWHWMNGNITKHGIRNDIEWMNRAGIGGFHIFDAGMATPQVVPERLIFMTPGWKDALKYAVDLGDSLGMEVAMTSAPGWSNTGGPWVKPEDAMKKLTWRTINIKGGKKVTVTLPAPYKTTGFFQNMAPADNATTFISGKTNDEWYQDVRVVAIPNDESKVSNDEDEVLTDNDLSTFVTLTPKSKDDKVFVQIKYSKPTTIKSLSICDGNVRSEWADAPAPVTKYLEASDDGKTWRKVCDIPTGEVALQTIDIPKTKSKYFRVLFDAPVDQNPYAGLDGKQTESKPLPVKVYELNLYPELKINHAEEKAGFATPFDLEEYPTKGNGEFASSDNVIDVTDYVKDGVLTWDAPKGNWTIYRFGYSLTGKRNHPASPEATGLEVTKLDSGAVARYINHYIGLYKDATGGKIGKKGITHFLIDSYEAGWETWCPKMAEEFQKRRGYSLWKWMPVLTGQIIDSPERSEEFLFDWRKTIGELIHENLYGQIARIAHDNGMTTYFEAHENGRLYEPDGMDVKRHADIPMAAAWCPTKSSSGSTVPMAESDIRESSSVMHLYGKKFSAGESLTANGMRETAYKFYPGNLKPVADMMMANGQTRFVIHESTHQPVDSLKPGLGMMIFGQWFNRNETWAERAKPWTDYLSRSCYLLGQGKAVADIAYYYGEDNNVTSLFGVNHPNIPDTYYYDYVNPTALIDLLEWDGKEYTTPCGMTYRVLALDKAAHRMPLPILRKINRLAEEGGLIIGDSPDVEPTLNGDKGEFASLCDNIWGKQRSNVLSGVSVAEGLKRFGIEPDFEGGDSLRYVHRTVVGGIGKANANETDRTEIYWVSNTSDKSRTVKASFRIIGMKPVIWHPEDGRQEDADYEIKDGRTIVNLPLTEHDAVFVVFTTSPSPIGEGRGGASKVDIIFRHLDTPWTVTFNEKNGGPRGTQTFDKLISWTDSQNDSIKYYSGTAVYHNSLLFSETELHQGRYILDLGKVGCIATVSVNGKEIATLWHSPYRVDITDALKAQSLADGHKGRTLQTQIDIEVINLWPNRIIGDQQPGCKHKYTYTSFPYFYKADSKLVPSGLMGPVEFYIETPDPRPYHSVKPGQVIIDNNGKPIQAHGFQIFEKDGTYYWYGENKEKTRYGSHVWTWGIRCYKSKDFYNWEDCGLIIPPDTVNPLSPLHYTQSLDRPHIIYCPNTGKYVCWIKSMDEDGYFVILQADDFLGPYTYVRSLKPEGFGVGDFDLWGEQKSQHSTLNSQPQKAYVWFERPHWELICATLTDDYTNVTDEYSEHFIGRRPPFTREAPTHFVRNGNHYLFTSGTTGYYPNETMVCTFTDPHGKYTELGNPHPADKWHHSFGSQITDVVKIPGKDLYIAVADRWMPQLTNTAEPMAEAKRMISKYKNHKPFDRDFSMPHPKDKRNETRTGWDITYNGTYVFLPIKFVKGKPRIDWTDEWKL